MKKLHLIVCILAALLFSNNVKSQQLKVLNQNKSSLSIELTIDNYNIKEIIDGDEVFHEIALNSIMIPNDKGKPNLPSVNRFVALPQSAKANVIVESYEKEILNNINIAPSKGIVSEYDTTDYRYDKDFSIYSKDELYPNNIVSLTEQMNLRGIDAVGLSIAPVQFNPVRMELVVYKKIKLRIEFEGEGNFGDDRLRSQYWDPILQHNILNYNNIPEIDYAKRMERWITDDAEGAEYLIIIPNNESFREQAQRLADYRSKQGIITKVYSLGDINVNFHEELRNWIVDAYNNWEIAPVAVCLLGDYDTNSGEGIPSYIIDLDEDKNYVSDRPYSDIDNDLLPELVFSRLCAANTEESKSMVNNLINYEFTDPVMEDSFYNNPITAYGFQNDKWFQICAESIGGYLRSKGKNTIRINEFIPMYEYDGEIWSVADNTDDILNYFGPNGLGYIPTTPDELDGFDGDQYQPMDAVINAINNGSFIVLHRDHGWHNMWQSPYLERDSLVLLNNGNKLPFILSINCASGAFNKNNCLLEAIMRLEDNGAIGCIGNTSTSHSFTNDSYTWGLWDFFDNDFLPDYGTSTINNNNYMPAFANVSAKYFIFQQNFPNTYQNTRELTSNIFHAFCDAFLKLYSDTPQQMTVEHDDTYCTESHSFNITAPVGSTISISALYLDGIKTLAITEGCGEMQTINIPDNITPNQEFYVTVTKTNYIRYEQNITVNSNESFVTLDDFSLYGDSNSLLFNQSTYLDLKLKNIGSKDASNVNLSLSCDSDKIDITSNVNSIDELGINETIIVDDAFYININDCLENGSNLVFTIEIEHNGIIHHEKFNVIVDAPHFEVINIETEEIEGNNNNYYEVGELIKFTTTIANTGNADSELVNTIIQCNDELLNVLTENIEIESIEANTQVVLEFEAIVNPQAATKEFSDLTLQINSGEYKFSKDFYCNTCIVIDDFENGKIDNNVWNQNDYPWQIGYIQGCIGNYCIYHKEHYTSYLPIILTTDFYFPSDGTLSFRYKNTSPINNIEFYIDNNKNTLNSNNNEWNHFETFVNEGNHSLTWKYYKDASIDDSYVYLDYITFRPGYDNVNETYTNNIIKFYPNPAGDFINIEIENNNNIAKSIEIINEMGISVISSKFSNKVDVSILPSGLYLIRINFEDYIHTEKVIIE